ncbi:MAG: BBP7 family outer membrane beta-barrel protein [Planctomycetota bacterium]
MRPLPTAPVARVFFVVFVGGATIADCAYGTDFTARTASRASVPFVAATPVHFEDDEDTLDSINLRPQNAPQVERVRPASGTAADAPATRFDVVASDSAILQTGYTAAAPPSAVTHGSDAAAISPPTITTTEPDSATLSERLLHELRLAGRAREAARLDPPKTAVRDAAADHLLLRSGRGDSPLAITRPADGIETVGYSYGTPTFDPACGVPVCDSQVAGCVACVAKPTWVFGVEGLIYTISDPDSERLLVECKAPGCSGQFFASDLSEDFAGGVRVSAFKPIDPCGCWSWTNGLEANAFWLDEFETDRYFTGPLLFIGGSPIGTGEVTVRYRSEILGAEINKIHPLSPWTNFLIGFRWINVEDNLAFNGVGTFSTITSSTDIENNLFGGQIGLTKGLYDLGGCLTIDGWAKVGLFGNALDAHSRLVNTAAAINQSTSTDEFEGTIVVDLQARANWAITHHLSATLGFQMIYIDELARAVSQFPNPVGQLAINDHLFIYGANAGITYAW